MSLRWSDQWSEVRHFQVIELRSVWKSASLTSAAPERLRTV
ncbi:hypothetical protein HMPREF0058_0787 [Actinomyces urogenitalis DSM 15434]|uniref:Uncharacterized protein n=1 Tax=Actinomyces urogenitalis DSM 15434 TaxID=525246 RepID=C0W4P0_9ACTO|nr:hypothetical protein HMPREF0058_0787 [Actinomyces urogenitalis DSM 15434]